MRSSKSKVENQSNSKNQKTAYCNCQVTTLIGTPLRSPLEGLHIIYIYIYIIY